MARLGPQINPNRNNLLYEAVEDEMKTERSHDAAVALIQDRLASRCQVDPNIASLLLPGR